jgi:hypothetical protein
MQPHLLPYLVSSLVSCMAQLGSPCKTPFRRQATQPQTPCVVALLANSYGYSTRRTPSLASDLHGFALEEGFAGAPLQIIAPCLCNSISSVYATPKPRKRP